MMVLNPFKGAKREVFIYFYSYLFHANRLGVFPRDRAVYQDRVGAEKFLRF